MLKARFSTGLNERDYAHVINVTCWNQTEHFDYKNKHQTDEYVVVVTTGMCQVEIRVYNNV